MDSRRMDLSDFHWLMDAVQSIDVGLVVLDRDFKVQVWNGFMENHSGLRADRVIGERIFALFPELPRQWFQRKVDSVFLLNTQSFTVWEQRPYLFRFKNYRPITGTAEFMYQNITFIPLTSVTGEVDHVGIIIYDVTDVATSRRALEEANRQLEGLSRTDRLTGLFNRGHWEERLREEFARFQRSHSPYALVMFDIDHFKKVNDTYGHQAGDEVIRQTAQALKDTARAVDIPGRYGGEEFGVILVDCNGENALYFAERLRKRVAALTVRHEDQEIRYTISLGIAELTEAMADHKAWIAAADEALYASKHGGRNRATLYAPGPA